MGTRYRSTRSSESSYSAEGQLLPAYAKTSQRGHRYGAIKQRAEQSSWEEWQTSTITGDQSSHRLRIHDRTEPNPKVADEEKDDASAKTQHTER